MKLNPEEHKAEPRSLTVTVGIAMITLAIIILLVEYQVFEKPDFGWATVLIVAGGATIIAYFTTRPEIKAAELGCALMAVGIFFLLKRYKIIFPYDDGFVWQGFLVALGIGGLAAFGLTRGKSNNLFGSSILIAVGAIFLMKDYYYYGFGQREWILAGTILMICFGLILILKSFSKRGNNDDNS